jgi:peptidoglycan/LPS O-acetylase OafA/YrhL
MRAVASEAPQATALARSAAAPGSGHQARLDGLRGIGMLIVVLGHAAFGSHTFLTGSWYGRILFACDFPIPAFFMLSAFLLYRPMFAARFRGRPSPSRRRYFKRRVARVVPAYWLTLTLAGLLLASQVPGVFRHHWWFFYGFAQIYSNQTFSQGLAVAWTLCIEVTLYLALPLLDVAIRALARRLGTHSWRLDVYMLIALGLLSFAFRLWVARTGAFVLTESLFGVFIWIVPGMLLAIVTVIYADREIAELPRWLQLVVRKPLFCWLAVACLILVTIPLVNSRTYLQHPASITRLAGETDFLAQVLIAALFVMPGMIPGVDAGLIGLPRRVLSTPWLCWLGPISYGIYLWHEPIMGELYKLGLFNLPGSTTVNLFIAALLASVLIASASWYLLERPLLNRVG